MIKKNFIRTNIHSPCSKTNNFKGSIKNSSTLLFDIWNTDRKTVDTQLEYRVDIGSAQNNISPKCLIVAHQTAARIGVPNKAKKLAVFDDPILRECHVDVDGITDPRVWC